MFYISKKFKFSAAHTIDGHPKCGKVHGHNYEVEVSVKSLYLDHGMLWDYNDMKAVIGPIIDEMDHRFLVTKKEARYNMYQSLAGSVLPLPLEIISAENLAAYLYGRISPLVPAGVGLVYVSVSETDGTTARFCKEDSKDWEE